MACCGLAFVTFWPDVAAQNIDKLREVIGDEPVAQLEAAVLSIQLNDPLSLARRVDIQTLQDLSIDLDVGKQDSLAYDTNRLAQALRARGLTVALTTAPGGHKREYWRAHTYEYFSALLDIIGVWCDTPICGNRTGLAVSR
jgi:hypothetical protein